MSTKDEGRPGLFSFKNYRFCVLLKGKIASQVQRSKTHKYQLKDMSVRVTLFSPYGPKKIFR